MKQNGTEIKLHHPIVAPHVSSTDPVNMLLFLSESRFFKKYFTKTNVFFLTKKLLQKWKTI